MRLAVPAALVIAVSMVIGPPVRAAIADHDHAHMHQHEGSEPAGDAPVAPSMSITGSFALGVTSYSNSLYEGDYESMRASISAGYGPFELGVDLAAYRLRKNGLLAHGIGDLGLHASWVALERGAVSAGIMGMAGIPTGDSNAGLGMGHLMFMGHAFVSWMGGATALTGSLGYGRALGGANAHAHHGGGAWPLVDPMTTSELTATVMAERMLGKALSCAGGLAYAEPVELGARRLVVEAAVTWRHGRYTTKGAFLAGLAGEPFDLRGVMTGATRF